MIKQWPEIIMYTRPLCVDCVRSKNFLNKNKIPFKEINILEDNPAQQKVKKMNKGRESVPVILLNNSTVIIEPTDYELIKAIEKESKITDN